MGNWEDVIAIIKEDNSFWVWGYAKAAYGAREGFVQILDNMKQVSVNDGKYGVAVKEDNSMWIWGTSLALDLETEIPILYAENLIYIYQKQK